MARTSFRPATADDLRFIENVAPPLPLAAGWSRPTHEMAWCMTVDGCPQAAGGIVDLAPGVAWLWLVFTDAACPWFHRLQRAVRDTLPLIAEEFDRVLMGACTRTAIRWGEALGFERTGEVLDGYEVMEWRS